jgi:hypothetical protein
MHRGIIKEHIGPLVHLLAKWLKAFDKHWRVYFPFNHVRHKLIVPFEKTSHVQTLIVA